MGGRGSAAPAASLNDQRNQEIHIDIIEKPRNGPWRIIGTGPDQGYHVSRSSSGGIVVRDSVTDETIASGRSITDALRDLAKRTGRTVNYVDETAGDRVLGRFGPS